MIDFHCHLDLYPDPRNVAFECLNKGVRVLSVTTTPSAWTGTSSLEEGQIETALGLHPQLAHERKAELGLFDELIEDVFFVGEVGLDGGVDYRSHRDDQAIVFDHVLRSCGRAGGRIISIHSRRAVSAVLDCFEWRSNAGIAVLHWFAGGFRDLDRAINLGCWFSVGPTMLNSKKGRQLAKRMPRNRVLTESDGPFAQIEGNSASPWDVDLAVKQLAALWRCSVEETEFVLANNLKSLTDFR